MQQVYSISKCPILNNDRKIRVDITDGFYMHCSCLRSLEKIILEAVMITCWLKVLEVSIVTVCLIMLLQIKIGK